MQIKQICSNKVVRNASWLLCGKMIYMFFAFFMGLLTTRYLGPSSFGLINYAQAYVGFFTSICTLGINSIIVKEFIENPQCEGEILGSALVARIISSALSVVIIFIAVSIVDKNDTLAIQVVLLASLGLVFQTVDILNYWFQAHLQSKYSAIASTLAYVIMSIYKLFLLIQGMSVIWFAISMTIDYVAVAVVLLLAYKKNNGPRMSFSLHWAKHLVMKGYPFIISGAMVAIYNSTDKLMLKHMVGQASTGYYATANTLCGCWAFVLTAVIDSMYPSIMKNRANPERYKQLNVLLYTIVFYICAAVSVVFIFAGEWIVNLLYGSDYLPAVQPVKILALYTAFSYLGVARNAWVVGQGLQKKLIIIYASAAMSNIIINAILIPNWGASGAAFASLLTQISTILIFPSMVREMRPNVKLILRAMTGIDLIKGLKK